MAEKTLNARMSQKHDIEANWNKATNFVPLAGEIIFYDPDEKYNYTRTKVGDGITKVNDLPFSNTQVQVITSDTLEILSTLNIHKMTQEEYDQALANGTLENNTIYLTPDEAIDLTPYATIEQLNLKADIDHNHNDIYYTEVEIDTLLANKSDKTHKHDGEYDVLGSAIEALNSAKSYADSVANEKANAIKNDLLNGAGDAYDTLKELGDLIDENTDAIEALETIASNKADVSHTHNDIYYTENEIDNKISVLNTSIVTSLSEAKSYSDTNLNNSRVYIDNAVSQKSQVQIVTWEADD